MNLTSIFARYLLVENHEFDRILIFDILKETWAKYICWKQWKLRKINIQVAALEIQNILKHNQSVDLSVQELIDCGGILHNIACYGGSTWDGMWYPHNKGMVSAKDYPYVAEWHECRSQSMPRIHINVTDLVMVNKTDEAIMQAVENVGPVTAMIDATLLFRYHGGIFNPIDCTTETYYGVLIVGYGTENGTDYWIIQNSVGAKWGENGYFRLARTKTNICGIWTKAAYPLLD